MADPIYASPMVDPQVAINQLSTLYTSEHLTENYNTFFNDKTENERLTYMPEGYEDQIDFDPFQSDYGLDFKSTLESEGFVNYVKNKPVRATPSLAAGPTVTVGGVLSAEELRRRMAGPIEDRSVYLDEVLPFYPGQEAGEGSVFDYWKSIPNISSFSEGLRGSLYGVSQREKEKEEEAPTAPVQAAAQRQRTILSPGYAPGPGIDTPSYTGKFSDIVSDIFSGITEGDFHASNVQAAANIAEGLSQTGEVQGPHTGLESIGQMGGSTGDGDSDGTASVPSISVGGMGTPATSGGGHGGKFCWVARKIYGEDNPKWQIFRSWLCTQAPKWLYKAYGKYGESFAEWLDGKERTQKIIRKWMDKRIQKYLDTQPKTAQEIGPL